MEMGKYRDRTNYVQEKGEFNDSPSMTVEGEAYTIQELYERSAGHLKEENIRQEIYDDDPTHDDVDYNEIRNADLTEKQEALSNEIEKDVQRVKKKTKPKDAPLKDEIKDDDQKPEVKDEKPVVKDTPKSDNSPS